MSYSLEDVLKEERELLNSYEERVDSLIDTLGSLSITDADKTKLLEEVPHEYAVIWLEDTLLDIVVNAAKVAAVSTGEFNYIQYINKLEQAIACNIKKIVFIDYDRESHSAIVSIDFSPLGGPDDWGYAVKYARELLSKNKLGPKEASRFWSDFIYGTARENLRVTKVKKGKRVDETSRFIYIYGETVSTRLEALDACEAPFWYLINYGNTGIRLSSDRGGTPYPKVSPTYFVENLAEKISNVYYNAFCRYRDAVNEEFFRQTGFTIDEINTETFKEELEEDAVKSLLDIVKKGGKVPYGKTLVKEKIEKLDITKEYYLTRIGNIATRYRNRRGQLTKKIPLN